MPKALVIVESPTKAKTINKYLGKQFVVKASLGHIKDLPKRDLAVDIEHGFEPRYEIHRRQEEAHQRAQASRQKSAGHEDEVLIEPGREPERGMCDRAASSQP